MSTTLNARIPFPEQADGLDVVLPAADNPGLYRALANLPEGAVKEITAKEGTITVTMAPVEGQPGAHEKINEVLSELEFIKVTRRNAELLMAGFALNERNRPLLDIETMHDTIVGLTNTGDTTPIKPSDADDAPANETFQQKLARVRARENAGATSAEAAQATLKKKYKF